MSNQLDSVGAKGKIHVSTQYGASAVCTGGPGGANSEVCR